MDIWSAGCVLFEVVSKQPLFPGANELDQIHRIHNVMGTPSSKLLRHMLGNRADAPKFQFAPKEGMGIRQMLPYVSQDCVDIINALLIYNPDERSVFDVLTKTQLEFDFDSNRITAKDALKHAFFNDITNLKSATKRHESTIAEKQSKQLKTSETSETIDSNVTLVSHNNYIKQPKDANADPDDSSVPAATEPQPAEAEIPSAVDAVPSKIQHTNHDPHERPKAKEIEPQAQADDVEPNAHRQPSPASKPRTSHHVHLPAIEHSKHENMKQHEPPKYSVSQLDHQRLPETQEEINHHDENKLHPHEATELYVRHPPHLLSETTMSVHQGAHNQSSHAQMTQTHPHQKSENQHTDFTQHVHQHQQLQQHQQVQYQQHHQVKSQKQLHQQWQPHSTQQKLEYLQSLSQPLQGITKNESVESLKDSAKKRGIPVEKKAAEAVLARARRVQQPNAVAAIGPPGDGMKRYQPLGKFVARGNVTDPRGVRGSSELFGVVGKVAPTNNTKVGGVFSHVPKLNSYLFFSSFLF
ncbi:hypothetical protein HDU84_007594 [Entophlyctis sp. JEL0112]|nr:hypothetical protein HDU84_007594 [Entophlyctis sp. JEL0112]